jgi:hypothetical protein
MRPLFVIASIPLLAGSLWSQLQTVNLQTGDKVDAVAIVVTRFGPYPASFSHPAAPFLLSVVNRSGVLADTFSLILKPSTASDTAAASLLDLRSTANRQRDHQIVKPLPGSYQLRFKSHPEWVVDITITAN